MPHPSLSIVLDILPALSASERLQILTRCRALAALDDAKDPVLPLAGGKANAFDWLVDGIREALLARGQAAVPSHVLVKLRAYKRFETAASWVVPWLDTTIPQMSRTERLALGIELARVLALYIASFKEPRPATLNNLLWYYDHIQDALEHSYPGYVEHQWLSLLIRR